LRIDSPADLDILRTIRTISTINRMSLPRVWRWPDGIDKNEYTLQFALKLDF
jgi:hypothetical protein